MLGSDFVVEFGFRVSIFNFAWWSFFSEVFWWRRLGDKIGVGIWEAY